MPYTPESMGLEAEFEEEVSAEERIEPHASGVKEPERNFYLWLVFF